MPDTKNSQVTDSPPTFDHVRVPDSIWTKIRQGAAVDLMLACLAVVVIGLIAQFPPVVLAGAIGAGLTMPGMAMVLVLEYRADQRWRDQHEAEQSDTVDDLDEEVQR